MYAVIITGEPEFVKEAGEELKRKGFQQIAENVYIANSVPNFEQIVRGLKDLSSYKKYRSKNSVYKTTSLLKI